MKIISAGRSIDHTLKYRDVRFQKQEVGRIPSDIFLPTDKTPPLESLKKVKPIIVRQPEMVDGEAKVREVSERFQASAPSPLVGGSIGAAVGGIAGAIIGGIATLATGSSTFLMAGGALGVAGGAILGSKNAASKDVQLVVNERSIVSHHMSGIHTQVSRGSLKGKSGYYHSFSAQLQQTTHGSYDVPRIQTVKRADQ